MKNRIAGVKETVKKPENKFKKNIFCVLEKVQQMGCVFLCVMIICIAATHKCLCWGNKELF